MFKKILIANRGEIACRVIKTAKKMGIKTVAVYSDADAAALHVQMADEAVHIGPPPANQSYIVIDKIMDAIKKTGAEAVHPGYGFLSENAKFAEALDAAGVAFIGPPKGAIEAMGDKITSKKLASEAGVSTVPGYMGLIADADEAVKISNEIGYPVMIKASAGGGGKGMRIAWNDAEAREGFQSSKNEAANSFGDDRIFIEKFVTQPRHIEIQVLADSHGNTIYLNERECSIQRRNQKVIEEAPSPFLDEVTRAAMGKQSCDLAAAVGYTSAGTVEFIVDGEKNFYFLEMNTRLQVEHPVTELITGIDLVEQMIRVAYGEKLSITQSDIGINGWAMESRLYAEDPYRGFLPSIGRLTRYRPPAEVAEDTYAVRNDTGVYEGGEISMFYDPMIAKLCTWAPTRADAIEEMRKALDAFEVEGIGHNIPFLAAVYDHPKFITGDMTTAFIEEEYPDGFEGTELGGKTKVDIALAAAVMQAIRDNRAKKISGQMREPLRIFTESLKTGISIVSLNGESFRLGGYIDHPKSEDVTPPLREIKNQRHWLSHPWSVKADVTNEKEVQNLDGWLIWHPGKTLARASFGGRPEIQIKVEERTRGFRLRYRGADFDAVVMSRTEAKFAAQMPEKLPPDTSKMLLCPMPGLIVKIDVAVGDEVQPGQALCTVEAMKMENILRAEKKAVVKAINAEAGASLAVDDVIMEFE